MREEKSPHTWKPLTAGDRGVGRATSLGGERATGAQGAKPSQVTTEMLLNSASQRRGGRRTRAARGLVWWLRLPGLGPGRDRGWPQSGHSEGGSHND